MSETTPARPGWALAAALLAAGFGIVTIVVAGRTLFGDGAETAGNVVPFVLWFNFIAGFAYVIAAYGIFRWTRWAAHLSSMIALSTVAVFAAFGVHVLLGGVFEMRTVGAMTIRSVVW